MALISVIGLDPSNLKHRALAAGDLIAAASVLSADAGNAAVAGSDGGVFVAAQVVFPDDQELTAGTSTTTVTTLTPTVTGDETDYQVTVDVKVSTTAGNKLVVDGTGLFVAPAESVTTAAPATTNDGSTPTVFFGGNSSALGTPEGWIEVSVAGLGVRKLAFYPV